MATTLLTGSSLLGGATFEDRSIDSVAASFEEAWQQRYSLAQIYWRAKCESTSSSGTSGGRRDKKKRIAAPCEERSLHAISFDDRIVYSVTVSFEDRILYRRQGWQTISSVASRMTNNKRNSKNLFSVTASFATRLLESVAASCEDHQRSNCL